MKPADRYWLCYAAGLVLAGLASMLERHARGLGGPASRYGPLLGCALVAVGILAWVRGRRLGRPWVWSLLAWIVGLASASALGWGLRLAVDGNVPPAAWLLVGGALSMPAAIALYRYAARSPSIWNAS